MTLHLIFWSLSPFGSAFVLPSEWKMWWTQRVTPPLPPPVTAIRFLECLSALRKLESSKLHASDTLAANGLHAKQVSPTAHIRVRFAGAVLMLLADKAVETLVFPQQCFNVQCLDPSVLRRGGDRGVVSSQIRLRDCGQLGSLGCPGLFQPF